MTAIADLDPPPEATGHVPVMLAEAVAAVRPGAGELIVDATFGGGGYTRALLDAALCRVIGLDRDPDAVARGRATEKAYKGRFLMVEGRFGDLETLVGEPADAIVLDVGVSSFQLDEAERGFSFMRDGALDMRMGQSGPSAADAVNALSEAALVELLHDLGEENDARQIARAIVQARAAARIDTTAALAALVERAVGGRRGAKTHPATKTFQALRMLVNDELGELARALAGAEAILRPGGRLVVVSFHSLEDRLVKQFFVARSGGGGGGSRHLPEAPAGPPPSFRLASRKPITPSEAEIAANPRARSASLRAGERTHAPAWGEASAPTLAPRAVKEWEALR